MKTYTRNILMIVLCVCAAVCFAFAGCKKAGSDITILDWEDEQITVILDTAYEVPVKTARDADGNEYEVSIRVERISDGKSVTLIYGAFDVVDVLGYKIHYTAHVLESEAIKTVTMAVKDEGRPVILTDGNNIAEVGVKYMYPSITVLDDSGKDLTPVKEVYFCGEETELVESTEDGFVPDACGLYELRITAEDESGNRAEATFFVFAREPKATTEIDACEDAGVSYTMRAVSGSEESTVSFVKFSRLSDSEGSAFFQAGNGNATGLYLEPRNMGNVVEDLGNDAYISAWIYISSSQDDTAEVTYGSHTETVAANEWTEICILREYVGTYRVFLARLDSGSVPLFDVKSASGDFCVFVDDIFAVTRSDLALTGLEASYVGGAEIRFGIQGENAKVSVYSGGKVSAVENGSFTAEVSGVYLLSVYSEDRSESVKSYRIVAEGISCGFEGDLWFKKGSEAAVPDVVVKDGETVVDGVSKVYVVDLFTGESVEAGETLLCENDAFALYAESAYNGEKTAAFGIFATKRYDYGTWCSFDTNASQGAWCWDGASVRWAEEFDGAQGVLVLESTTPGEKYYSNHTLWRAAFPKVYYEQFDKIVFRLKANKPGVNLSFMPEGGKTAYLPLAQNISTEWTEYSADISNLLEEYDAYNDNHLFYSWCGEGDYIIYIDSITAVKTDPADLPPEGTWYLFDDETCADSVWSWEKTKVTWLAEEDGETGVVKIETNEAGESYFSNKAVWKPAYNEAHYADYDYLVFRMKTDKPGAILQLMNETSGGYITPEIRIDSAEWKDYTVSFQEIYAQFEGFRDNANFRIWYGESAYTIYIDGIRAVKEEDSGSDAPADAWYLFDDETCADGGWSWAQTDVTWLAEEDGATGVLKVYTNTSGESYFNNKSMWRAVFDEAHYAEYDYLVFRMKTDRPGSVFQMMNEGVSGLPGIAIVSAEWTEYYVSMQEVKTQFSGYRDNATFRIWNGEGAYTIYIDSIRAMKTVKESTDGIWYGFDEADCTIGASIDDNAGRTSALTWEPEVDGETGVLVYTSTTGAGRFFHSRSVWNAEHEKEYYAGYTKVVFRMKADVEGCVFGFYVNGGSEYSGITVGTEWADYEFDITNLYNEYEGFNGNHLFYVANPSTGFTFYIDSISVK